MQTPEPAITRGIVIFIGAWLIIPVMDGGAKYLGQAGYSVLLVVWARYAINLIMVVPLAKVASGRVFAVPPDAALQTVRAVSLVGATLGFYMGIQTLPLVEALAIYFVYPLIVTALAPLMLSEIPGVRRWMAVGVGFAGSLLVIQPGGAPLNQGTPYVLGGAVCFAIYNILTRKLSGRSDAWQKLTFQMLVGTVIMAPVLLFVWQPVSGPAVLVLIMMASASTIGHYLIIRAYEYAPASVLAPFSYFEIVSMAIIGFFVFGDIPTGTTWAGAAVIVLSGVYISLRERRRATEEVRDR